MQIPSLNVRPLAEGEEPRADELAITEEQASQVEQLKLRAQREADNRALEQLRQEELASRRHLSRGSRRRFTR